MRQSIRRNYDRYIQDLVGLMLRAVLVVGAIIWVGSVAVTMRTTMANTIAIAGLQTELRSAQQLRQAHDEEEMSQLNEIARTLYASPQPPLIPNRRPSSVEIWQVNRDNELRSRLLALERARMQIEAQLAELRAQITQLRPVP